MNAPRNSRSFLSAFQGFDTTLREIFVERPKAYAQGMREKLRDLPRTNFEMGCQFAAQNLWQDAVFRFRVAIWLRPNFVQAWYNLGCSQVRLGQKAKARQSFLQALRIDPGHTDSVFMLSALDPASVPPAQRPQRMQPALMKQFFTGLAANYDAIELQNQYEGGRQVFDVVQPLLAGRKDLVVVDLGCGTGLASRPWRPLAKEVVGVDFTPALVAVARGEQKEGEGMLFARVLEEDVYDLQQSTAPIEQADLILLVNVAQFLGNLEPVFAALGARMKAGAKAVVTIEALNAPSGYMVNLETGRFGHHPEYIKQQAGKAGLSVAKEARVQLYPSFTAQVFVVGK